MIVDLLRNDKGGSSAIDSSTINLNATSVNGLGSDTNRDGYIDRVVVPNEGVWELNTTTAKLIFIPKEGFRGNPTPIEYSVKDGFGTSSNDATVTVHYTKAPKANDDKVSAMIGEAVTIEVLKNDIEGSDPLDPATVMIVDPNTHSSVQSFYVLSEGTWEVSATGKITFTPEQDFSSNPTPITYSVEDEGGRVSNEAKVIIYYNASVINATDNLDIPVRSASPFAIDVLKNGDSFGVNGAGRRPIEFTQAKHGRVYLDDGGTPFDPTDDMVLYEAEPDYIGEVSFTYTIYDAQGNKDTAVVTLNVDCATSQSSDNGSALGMLGIILMSLIILLGRSYLRRNLEGEV